MRGAAFCAALFVAAVSSACGAASAPLTNDQIVAAFIGASQDDARTMHMEWTGSVATSGLGSGINSGATSQTLNGTFDFNGLDYAGVLNTAGAGVGANQTAYARVNGVTFMNFSNAGWQREDNGLGPREIDPMRGLTADALVYDAPDTLDGKAVHRLRVKDAVGALTSTLFPTTSMTDVAPVIGGRSDFLIYVDDKGIPVGAQVAVDLGMQFVDVGSASPPDTTISFSFTYTFSLWGEPVTISAPQISGNGFPPFGGGGGLPATMPPMPLTPAPTS